MRGVKVFPNEEKRPGDAGRGTRRRFVPRLAWFEALPERLRQSNFLQTDSNDVADVSKNDSRYAWRCA